MLRLWRRRVGSLQVHSESVAPLTVISDGTVRSRKRYRSSSSKSNNNVTDLQQQQQQQQQHDVIVLVHGWMGNSKELKCLEERLREKSPSLLTSSSHDYHRHNQNQNSIVTVHNATCNSGRTSDGVQAGGERLAKEIRTVLLNESPLSSLSSSSFPVPPATSLSIIGNSLGGLYARYALGCMNWQELKQQQQQKGAIDLELKVFCSLNTPHLGLQKYHHLLPTQLLEAVLAASFLQQTGKDLFEEDSPLISTIMATDPRFIDPLSKFHLRMAHANVHGTDLLVPTASSAFLEPDSTSLLKNHYFLEEHSEPFSRVSFETKPQKMMSCSSTHPNNNLRLSASQRLDALGWHKVFWDLSNPQQMMTKRMDGIQQSSSTTSQHLFEEFCSAGTSNSNNYFQWGINPKQPFGHTMMVANSKNAIYEHFHQSGRPIMEHLAQTILDEL